MLETRKDHSMRERIFLQQIVSQNVTTCEQTGDQLQRRSLRGFVGVPIPTFVRGHECFCDVLKPMQISSPNLILIELLNLAIQYQQI
jgi:hypothetical protein